MSKGITGSERVELIVQGREVIEIGLTATDYLINWGDGSSSRDRFHVYLSVKEKSVCVTGKNIRELVIRGKGIVSLKVIGCFAMHHITCSDCNLSCIELDCINLRGLSMQNNRVTQLSLNSSNLDWLVCDNNDLHELDLASQSRLVMLSCKHNYLEKLRLPKLNFVLKSINCACNNLSKEELNEIAATLPKYIPYTNYLFDYSLNPGTREVNFSDMLACGWKLEESYNTNLIEKLISKFRDLGYLKAE